MNKSAIKTYAVWARTELIKLVTQRAYEYEVTADNTPAYNTDSVHGRPLESEEKKQLNELIDEVNKHGFEHVIEEVAYTWFNRFIALRYMEVNNYLPQKVRVFTNENNEFKPELLTDAIHIELDGLDKQKVFDLIDHNNQEDLYKYLLLTLCNDMNQYLPDMFASISDYKSLLMPNNLLREDSIIGRMIADIDEDSWNDQVQIIGWLYQYYNSERNNLVYSGSMSKSRITKDLLPAATTIYTPDWVTHYMVENSLGKLWIEGHPDFDHSGWKYYLEEVEQEPEVFEQLKKIREEHSKLKPEDIKVIDPCMGSGHILVYAFDVLMDIYRDNGYTDRNAAKSILENNIYGLEIDERAYHLAYFALMMRARSYNRRILSKETKINILEIREPMGVLKEEYDHYLGDYAELSHYLVNEFSEAKELGSIINLSCTLEQLEKLEGYINSLKNSSMNQDMISYTEISEISELLLPLLRQAKLLVCKYNVVTTNPPYLKSSRFSKYLNDYTKNNYKDVKSDLCMIMYKRWLFNLKINGFSAFLTPTSWMFLSSFEEWRKKLLKTYDIDTLVDFGSELFEGKVGHNLIVSWVTRNKKLNINGSYIRLVDYCYSRREEKKREYFNDDNLYISSSSNYIKIPGSPIAYWVSNSILENFNNPLFGEIINTRVGLDTGDNDRYIRLWEEVDLSKIIFDSKSKDDVSYPYKWVPHTKGGPFRKWFGNLSHVLAFDEKNYLKLSNSGNHLPSRQYYFLEGITWSRISSGNFSVRYTPSGMVFNSACPTAFASQQDLLLYSLGFLNSKLVKLYISILSPTLNFQAGDINKIPFIIDKKMNSDILIIVNKLIKLSKSDWDSFETSWDFKIHPLVKNHVSTISEAHSLWSKECDDRFDQLKTNEEELNKIFINIYGLQSELTPEVEDKDVTARKAELVRDVKSFISYAVGCMFGRYSLDTEGLAYAGGEWDNNKYKTFIPDSDDIIPICDEEYFEDDIVSRFIEFIRCVYGDDTLEENLQFISDALGGNGNPRDVLRNYFLKEFFKDHCNTYQVTGSGKRPIYWQFDSGKKNGFKALVYIHRYTPDLIAKMRTGYIHPLQSQYRTQIEMLNNQIDESSSTSEKVKLKKQLKKITEQAEELGKYEEKIHHWADKMEPMNLDDGVVVNYNKFQVLLVPNMVKKLK